MTKHALFVLLAVAAAPRLAAQSHAEHHSAPAPSQSADIRIPPTTEQIAGAVVPAPQELRAGAQVPGYSPEGKLVELRKGTNDMVCLADDPKEEPRWHVACYHASLEAFMARGRELIAQGITGPRRDSVRNGEIISGRIKMPPVGVVYTLTARAGCFNPETGALCDHAQSLHSVYVPFATTQSTGLLEHPTDDHTPWLMEAGTPKAHIMFGAHQHH